jgi:hypothetical protein
MRPSFTERVHDVRIGGSVWDAAGLVDRQGVHVGAQADCAVRLAFCQRRNHTVATDIADEGDAEFPKTGLDEGSCVLFMQCELGVGVDMAPPSRQPVVQ